MNLLLLDTSFILALHSKRDQHFAEAKKCWAALLAGQTGPTEQTSYLTTTFVLDEVVTYFNACSQHGRAVQVGREMFASSAIELIPVDEKLLVAGWNYFVRHQDKRYSLTDCISFVVMEARGLKQALTFDHHFTQAGFDCLPHL